MARRTPHFCHAEGCETKVPPSMLMCLKHWRMVPKPLQNAVWEHYVPGQEIRMNPSGEYVVAAQAAVDAVAAQEGRR
jgi:hypothetical protein